MVGCNGSPRRAVIAIRAGKGIGNHWEAMFPFFELEKALGNKKWRESCPEAGLSGRLNSSEYW